jgi:N-methylhydantoinase B/oxoprolinase/acetone carboxylase alpha subunit
MSGNADGEKFGSEGLLGGKGGTKTKLKIVRKGKSLPFRTFDLQYLKPGDTLVSYSGGGGGVGNPLNREIEKVRLDALNEYISIKAARDLYGVVIDPKTFKADVKATKALRTKLRGGKERGGETRRKVERKNQ